MNTKRSIALSVLSLLALAGCSKDGGSTVCTPDHTTVAEGGFCVKIPKDAKAGPPKANEYSWTWQTQAPLARNPRSASGTEWRSVVRAQPVCIT